MQTETAPRRLIVVKDTKFDQTIVGTHHIAGVAQVHTSTVRDCARFNQFMYEILALPEVQAVQDKWLAFIGAASSDPPADTK